MEYNNELRHYGVKGMKWGVRKKPEYNESIVGRKNPSLSKYERDRGINYGGARRNGSSDLRDASAIGTAAGKALRKGVEKAKDKGAKVSSQDARNAASKALDKLDDYMFFNGDNIPNNFAIRAGIRTMSDGLARGDSIMDTALSALDDYRFFAD